MKAITHKGLEVELFFFEQDPNDQKGLNEGWVCHRVEARVGGVVVGYLKIEYVPSATLNEKIPTLWHWWNGSSWSARQDDWPGVWMDAHFKTRIIPASLQGKLESVYRLSKGMAPDLDTIHRDLRALKKKVCGRSFDNPWAEFEDFLKWHMDRPKVAYIRTEHPHRFDAVPSPDWRRKGIATLLYVEGAKWMATKGFPLWASTLQQPEASAAWQAMAADGRYPVQRRAVPWKPEETVYVLDFTDDRDGHRPSALENRRLSNPESH